MTRNVTKGEEFILFPPESLNKIWGAVYNVINDHLLKLTIDDPMILGAFALHNVELIEGSPKNVWVEYHGNILEGGFIDVGVHKLLIYDEIPDELLDRFNQIKKLLKKETE